LRHQQIARVRHLKAIVCADPMALSTSLAPTLRKGIQRVH